MIPGPEITQRLFDRLRVDSSRSSVAGSLPVLFFGDLFNARIATVGLNPSDQEILDRSGAELIGSQRRFETLGSLEADSRHTLSAVQCERAIAAMRGYFEPGKPVYAWFRTLDRVVRGMGWSYEEGTAAHLDLVQEPTSPKWSELLRLERAESNALLASNLPFLLWQIDTFRLGLVVCNGRTVFDAVSQLLNAKVVETGRLARLTWYIARAELPSHSVWICGWNLPLARPTGLSYEALEDMGRMLADRMAPTVPSVSSSRLDL